MFVPLYAQLTGLDGHSLKIISALILRGSSAITGQIEIDDLRQMTGVSHARVLECLDRLEDAGAIRFRYMLGVIDWRVVVPKHVAKVTEDDLRALLSLGPSDVKLFFAVLQHCNPQDGIAWPGKILLARLLNRSRRTIERGIRALRECHLLLVRKVHWTQIPRFRWPKRSRPTRKRITVFMRLIPIATRTMSRSAVDLCRGVRRQLLKQLCLQDQRELVMVDAASLPSDLRASIGLGDTNRSGSWDRAGTLRAVGLTASQTAWVCAGFATTTVDLALRALNTRWRVVHDRVRYFFGCLRRLDVC